MITGTLKVRQVAYITYLKQPGPMIRGTKGWIKEAGFTALRFWQQEILPGHFEEGAGSKYHYSRRTYKTQKTKREKYGHNKPIYMSGQAEDMLESTLIDTHGTSNVVRGTLHGPWYIGWRKRQGRNKKGTNLQMLSPDLKSEIVAMNNKDAQALASVVRTIIYMKYNSFQSPRTKKVLSA